MAHSCLLRLHGYEPEGDSWQSADQLPNNLLPATNIVCKRKKGTPDDVVDENDHRNNESTSSREQKAQTKSIKLFI